MVFMPEPFFGEFGFCEMCRCRRVAASGGILLTLTPFAATEPATNRDTPSLQQSIKWPDGGRALAG
jgi:hypothetical protein